MKYVLGVLGAVILAILAIVLIGGRGPDTDSNGQKPGAKKAVSVVDYSNNLNSEVSWTIQGRLVGQDQRKSVRIVVSQRERRFEILNGYEESVESVQRFQNSPAAYDTFLRALDAAGFSKERKVAVTDERGVCPQGNRYIYDLEDGSDHVLRSWSTTCSTAQGNFAGNAVTTRQLFQDQIPEYSKLIQGVKLQSY
jgi:hypothetical protein